MPVEQRKAGRWRQRTKERRKHAPRMSSGLKSVKRNASMQTFNWCSASVGRPGNRSHPLLEPETSLDASADLLLEINHQLESRVPEIGLLGSEGGATSSVVPTPIILPRRSRGSVTPIHPAAPVTQERDPIHPATAVTRERDPDPPCGAGHAGA